MNRQEFFDMTSDLTSPDRLLEMARAAGFRGFENYDKTEALAPSSVEVWKRRMLAFAQACLFTERCGATVGENGEDLLGR